MTQKPVLLNVDEIPWSAQDPARAVVHGDPQSGGPYTMRVRIEPGGPGGRPHWHPHDEFGTVVSGTVYVAAGERTDRDAAKAIRMGAFIHIPPNVAHALWCEEPAVLQIHGMGPRVTHFADEPPR